MICLLSNFLSFVKILEKQPPVQSVLIAMVWLMTKGRVRMPKPRSMSVFGITAALD